MPNLQIDSIDRRILTALQRDAKQSNVELAHAVGLSPSPCLVRVKRLEKAGLINRYVALLDASRLGTTVNVFIQISLEKQTEQILDTFEKTVASIPEVMECYLMSGDSDYLLKVVVRDTEDLRHFIVDKLSKTPGVKTIRSSFSLKQIKYSTELPIGRLTDAR